MLVIITSSYANNLNQNLQLLKSKVVLDYQNFYSPTVLIPFSMVLFASAVIANTDTDQHIQRRYQRGIRSRTTDDIAGWVRFFGEHDLIIIYTGFTSIGLLTPQQPTEVSAWGERCLRAILQGLPPVLILQRVIDAGRPTDNRPSRWQLFKRNNGVSGHAFLGAIPFLTAATMTDKPLLKATLLIGSTLTGLSRINDNKHYFSQVLLGWTIAYAAVSAVQHSSHANLSITPVAYQHGAGVALSYQIN